MAAKNKKARLIVVLIVIFIVYFFLAARPIPRETVLSFNWITTVAEPENIFLNAEYEQTDVTNVTASGELFPFVLGNRFGYIDSSGVTSLNQVLQNNIYLSKNMWSQYEAQPTSLEINNITDNTTLTLNNTRGYPVLLDDRIFILGSEQNSLTEVDKNGLLLWTYEFGAPLTAIDVAAGFVITGSLDGAVEVFNSDGERIFYFDTGGSRYSIVLGCAISRDGSRIGVICGIEDQRFLLLERFGNIGGEYRTIHHEFLDTGFRRPVRIHFVDNDQRIIFEREGGLGCYSIRSRRSMFIPLAGEITAIEESGEERFLFLVTSFFSGSHHERQNLLVGVRFPPDRLFADSTLDAQKAVFLRAPFRTNDIFLGRSGSMLIAGGGQTLISFNLEEK